MCSGVNCEGNLGGGVRLWKLSWIWQTHRVDLGDVSVCSIQGGTGLERLFLILLELREQRHYVCHSRNKISSIGRFSCTFWFFLVQRGRSCDIYCQFYCLEQGCFRKQREHGICYCCCLVVGLFLCSCSGSIHCNCAFGPQEALLVSLKLVLTFT